MTDTSGTGRDTPASVPSPPGLRQVARDMLVYGSGDVALRAAALVTIPIYTRLFDPAEYGAWSFVASGVWLLNAVLLLGADTAYTRAYFAARTARERQTLTTTMLAAMAAWSVAVCGALAPLSGVLSRAVFDDGGYSTLFLVGLLGAPLVLLNAVSNVALRNEFRTVLYAILNLGTAALGVVLSLVCVLALDAGLVGLVLGPVIAAAVALPVRLLTIRALLNRSFSFSALTELLRVGVPLVPASVATWVFLVSDRLLIGTLSSAEQLGLYTIAAGLVSVLTLGDAAFGQAWLPRALQAYESSRAGAERLVRRALAFVLLCFGAVAVVLTAFAGELLGVLTTDEFAGAEAAVGPLALGAVAIVAARVTSIGIVTSRRTWWSAAIAGAAAVLNVSLNVAFVPEYGMVAAAWSSLATYVFVALAELVASRRLAGVRFDEPLALVATASVAVAVVAAREVDSLRGRTVVVLAAVAALALVWAWSGRRARRGAGEAPGPESARPGTSAPTARG